MYICTGFLLLSDCRNSSCATTRLDKSSLICTTETETSVGSLVIFVSCHSQCVLQLQPVRDNYTRDAAIASLLVHHYVKHTAQTVLFH